MTVYSISRHKWWVVSLFALLVLALSLPLSSADSVVLDESTGMPDGSLELTREGDALIGPGVDYIFIVDNSRAIASTNLKQLQTVLKQYAQKTYDPSNYSNYYSLFTGEGNNSSMTMLYRATDIGIVSSQISNIDHGSSIRIPLNRSVDKAFSVVKYSSETFARATCVIVLADGPSFNTTADNYCVNKLTQMNTMYGTTVYVIAFGANQTVTK